MVPKLELAESNLSILLLSHSTDTSEVGISFKYKSFCSGFNSWSILFLFKLFCILPLSKVINSSIMILLTYISVILTVWSIDARRRIFLESESLNHEQNPYELVVILALKLGRTVDILLVLCLTAAWFPPIECFFKYLIEEEPKFLKINFIFENKESLPRDLGYSDFSDDICFEDLPNLGFRNCYEHIRFSKH